MTKIYTLSSDPALVSSWDCKNAEELVCALKLVLEKNLSFKIGSEVILSKDLSQHPDTKHTSELAPKVIIAGESIVGQLIPLIRSTSLDVELTVPGWLPPPFDLFEGQAVAVHIKKKHSHPGFV